MALQVFSLNREVGVLSVGLDKGLENSNQKIDQLGLRIGSLETNVGRVDGKLTALGDVAKATSLLATKVDAINQQIAQLIAGGTNQRQTVAYTPCRSESTKTLVQCGKFSPDTKFQVAGRENVYRWKLLIPVDPNSVRSVWGFFSPTIPDVAVTARLVDGGKVCEMELAGKDAAVLSRALAQGMVGCVNITVCDVPYGRADPYQLEPTPGIAPSTEGNGT